MTKETDLNDKLDKTYFLKAVMVFVGIWGALLGIVYDNTKDTQTELQIYKDNIFTKMSAIEVLVVRIEENTKALKEDFKRLENSN